MEYYKMVCSREAFRPRLAASVRWLDWESDSDLARDLWSSGGSTYSDEEWETLWSEARAEGYRYCAVIEDDKIVSRAAVWRYSDEAWEVAAVYTVPSFRQRGYGKSVVSFATAHILEAGRVATCHTSIDNPAMIRTAETTGFCQVGTVNLEPAST
jgi:predicted GNAT family acetyltransferase